MGRIFSHIYDTLMQPVEWRMMGAIRSRVAGSATGRVLEIGVGSGLDLPYYRNVERVVGIDPDTILLERAERRARDLSVPVTLEEGRAESLPFPDHAFDTIVSALVLCTVPDAAQALREVGRTLRPGGRFLLVEHVRAGHPVLARAQDAITPAWRWCFGGCHPNRDTVGTIRRHGFDIAALQRHGRFGMVVEIEARCR